MIILKARKDRMKRNKKILQALYLPCAFALMVFVIGLIFHVLGYWVSGGERLIDFIKGNIVLYFKLAGVGFSAGVVLWFFYIR